MRAMSGMTWRWIDFKNTVFLPAVRATMSIDAGGNPEQGRSTLFRVIPARDKEVTVPKSIDTAGILSPTARATADDRKDRAVNGAAERNEEHTECIMCFCDDELEYSSEYP